MSKKPLILVPLLAAVLAGGYYWWRQTGESPQSRTALSLFGNVDIREVNLAFAASERIAELLVQEGDRVEPGQVLGRLNAAKLDAAVRAAEAAVNAQAQALAALQAGSRPEEIRRARAQADALAARARTAHLTFERQRKLGKQNLASPEDLDQARAAADAAEAEAAAAQATYDLAVAGARAEDIAQAQALLQSREANLALARQQLADATLIAPASGIVRERILEPGDMATPQAPALTLALMNPLWVRAYVPETDLGLVAPGMSAEIRTDSFPDKVYQGWIGFISPSAEFTPKNVETPELRTRLVYQIRAMVCDSRGELRLGMPATVEIPLDQSPVSPQQARPCGN